MAPILVHRDAPREVEAALADLVRYVEASTGVEVVVRRLSRAFSPDAYSTAIAIGQASGLDLGGRDLGFDGYRLHITNRTVQLAGPTPEGTANAIYDFLETGLGVVFLVPGEDGAIVPRFRDVRIPETDRWERPAFAHRNAWYNETVIRNYTSDQREDLRRFVRRNRGPGIPAEIRHYFAELVPPGLYFDEHPEYFAEVEGRRLRGGQLCTSQPFVTHLAVEHWKQRFARQPRLKIGSLSPNDGGLFCTCEDCRLQGPILQERLVDFMNEVTRRVAQEHPDRLLSFYAYGPLLDSPGIRLHPNLMPVVARYLFCQAHEVEDLACPSAADFRRQLDDWVAMSEQHMVREFGCWWHAPDLAIDVLAANLRAYHRRGALGVSREYLRRGFGSDLVRYLDLKLMWDPNEDVDRLVDNFLKARYGPAASGMRRVIDRFRTRLETVAPDRVVGGGDPEIFDIYPTSLMRSALDELDQLARATPGDHGRRVALEHDLLAAMLDFRRLTELTQRYSITGRNSDLDNLRALIATAGDRFRELESAGALGSSYRLELEELERRVEGGGLSVPIAGELHYEDDLAHGGFSRRDADRIEGFYPGRYGLALLPQKSGRISFTLEAEAGRRFARAELTDLVFRGANARIDVKVGGTTRSFSRDATYTDPQLTHDLTGLVEGAERFTIVFSAQNTGNKPLLCLDNWGIRVETR